MSLNAHEQPHDSMFFGLMRARLNMREQSLVAGTTVAILVVLSAGVSSCGGGCGNEILAEYPSPDRTRRIVVFQRDCGATTAFSTQASLILSGEDLPSGNGNVFIADTDHGAAPSGFGGGPELNVEWETCDQVLISHDPSARLFRAEVRLSDITIRYQTFVSED